MIDHLATKAELLKLGHLLEAEPVALASFADYDAGLLRRLREAMSAALFDEHRRTFKRLEAASRLLPNALVAKITTKVFGPVVAARVAGEMPASRAIDLAQRLPVAFMADICLHLDPRSSPDLVRGMPVPIIREIARILLRRRDFVTMGRFVDALTDAAISGVIPDIEDDGMLLQVAFYVEDRAHLDTVLSFLPDARLEGVIRAAFEQDLWAEALALMQHVGHDSRRRLGDLTAQQPDKLLADLVRVAQQQDLWVPVLAIIDDIPEPRRIRLANLKLLQKPKVLQDIMRAAHRDDLWHQVLPLLALMTVDHQRAVARMAMAIEPDVLVGMLDAAHRHGLWPSVINLISLLEPQVQAGLAEVVVAQQPAVIHSLIEAAAETDLWSELLPILDHWEPAQQARIVGPALDEGLPLLELAVRAAQDYQQWTPILSLLVRLEPALQRRMAESSVLPAKLTKALFSQASKAGLNANLRPLLEQLAG